MNAQDIPRENVPQGDGRSPGRYVRCIVKGLAVALGMGLIFWSLWNWVGVPLLAFPALTYFQGLGAVLLAAVLFCMGRRMWGGSGTGTHGPASRCQDWFYKCHPHRAGGK